MGLIEVSIGVVGRCHTCRTLCADNSGRDADIGSSLMSRCVLRRACPCDYICMCFSNLCLYLPLNAIVMATTVNAAI
jgi:hypothetical protein